MMKALSSTLLKYFTNNCPKALGNYENDISRDTDIFQTGIAGHAVLQVVGEKCGTDISNVKAVADAVVEELITKGRAFNNKPEPPMNPEYAFNGRDIAVDYIFANGLPKDGKYEIGLGMTAEGKACAYDAKDCRYRAITDVIYPDVDGDEDYQANVIVVRDYKSAWPTNADELETLQRKGQAVLTWLAYENDDSIQGIKLEVINLRTHQSFTKVIWLDEEGEQLLREWRDDILLLCNSIDQTREARPGGGCLGCAWCLSCEDSYKHALGDNLDPMALITLEARRTELLKALKAEITEDAVEVEGGYVGYQAKQEKMLTEDAVYEVLRSFYKKLGSYNSLTLEDLQKDYSIEISLLNNLKLGSGNINNIAKALYDKKEMDARNDLLDRCLQAKTVAKWGVWKK